MRYLIAILFGLFLVTSARAQKDSKANQQLWLYYPTNLLVAENIDKLEQIWARAAKAGYSHVLIADSKFSRLAEMDKRYFDNVAPVKRIAADLKLTVVPAVFSVGLSRDEGDAGQGSGP